MALDLGGEGEHAAKDLAERRDVVLGDPGGEAHEFAGKQVRSRRGPAVWALISMPSGAGSS